MRRAATLSLLTLLATGCTGPTYGYKGYNVPDYFPLDGDRSWKYVQDGLDWRLEVSKEGSVSSGDMEIVTLDYGVFDPAELLYSIEWSSDVNTGVLIHSYTVEDGPSDSFSNPIVFADPSMAPGESIETDGYISTFVEVITCPNDWVTEDWTCLHFQVTDGLDNENSAPFVGDWWLASAWGASWFQQPTQSSEWILSEASWTFD